MRIFADYHHEALGRSVAQMFGGMMGHEVCFPAESLIAEYADPLHGSGAWNVVAGKDWGATHPYRVVTRDDLARLPVDMILSTAPHSPEILDAVFADHPSRDTMLRVVFAGNWGTVVDWTRWHALISSDLPTYRITPRHIPRILAPQILGPDYHGPFRPITEDALGRIGVWFNHLHRWKWVWDADRTGMPCPQCELEIFENEELPGTCATVLQDTAERLPPGASFQVGGSENEDIGGDLVWEERMPDAIAGTSLTWHMKTYEGFGHSLLQAVLMGRPAIIPERFYRYKFAGDYLIEGSTSFEVRWDSPQTTADVVSEVCSDLETANRYARRCYDVAHALFDWEFHVWRVERWLSRLIP